MVLLPLLPDFRAEAHGGLFAVADDRGLHKGRIIKKLILFGDLIVHILHVGDLLGLIVPIDQVVHAAHGPQNAVKFFAGHTVAQQINILILDTPFLKITFRLFCIITLVFSIKTYIPQ